MINLPSTLWAWVPLLLAAGLSLVSLGYAKWKSTAPFFVPKHFFAGPAFTNSGAISTVLSMIPLILSSDVRADLPSVSLLGVATLLFSFTTFLGMWLYSDVASRTLKDDTVKLTNDVQIAMQGVIISCMIVAAGCFCAFVLVTPLLKVEQHPPAAGSTITLRCDAKSCVLAPKSKS